MTSPITSPDGAASQAAAGPQVAKGLAYLVRSTSRRPLTVAEARERLAGRDLDDGAIDEVVRRADRMKVLDDEAFATAWVQDRGLNRGYGRRRLQRELQRRKVDDDLIDRALSALDEVDEYQQALDLARPKAQRMPADLPPQRAAQRLVGFLVRRGFESSTATRAARALTALDRDWD